MRTAPTFESVLPREPVWLIAAASLGLLATLVLAAWATDGTSLRWMLPAGVAAGSGAWCVVAWRRPSQRLRWDGREWWCAAEGEPAGRTGRLAVALDLDVWMLLRFDPSVGSRRALWLAASRRGLGRDWPALRRAVYCARPGQTESAAIESSA